MKREKGMKRKCVFAIVLALVMTCCLAVACKENPAPAPEPDTTAPTIAISAISPVHVGESVTATFTATDASGLKEGSPAAALVAPGGGETALTAVETNQEGEYTVDIAAGVLNKEGTYTLKVTAEDVYGNDATEEETFTVSVLPVTVSVTYSDGDIEKGATLEKSKFTVNAQGAAYELRVERGEESVPFGNSYTFEEKGEYKVVAEVTEEGKTGRGEVTVSVFETIADLKVTRDDEEIEAFKTDTATPYALSRFGLKSGDSITIDAVDWTITKADETPVAVSGTDITFPENGTYTLTGAPARSTFYKGTANSVTVTVADLAFGKVSGDGKTTAIVDELDDNEGWGNIIKPVGAATYSIADESGETAIKANIGTWGANVVNITFPEPITVNENRLLYVRYYKKTQAYVYAYINGTATGHDFLIPFANGAYAGWTQTAISYADLVEKQLGADNQLSSIAFGSSVAGTELCISKIWLEDKTQTELTDLPENAKVLRRSIGTITSNGGWVPTGELGIDGEQVTIDANGTFAIRYKTGSDAAPAFYLGINSVTDDSIDIFSMAAGVKYTDYVVAKRSVADCKTLSAAVAAAEGSLAVEHLFIRVGGGYNTGVWNIDWIAYIPGEADSNEGLPQNAKLIYGADQYLNCGEAWGVGLVNKIVTLPESKTINKNGSIAVRIKCSAAFSFYIRANATSATDDKNYDALNTAAQSDWIVITKSIGELTNFNAAFASGDTLQLTSLGLRCSPSKGNTLEIDWIAYIPAEAV